MAQNIGTLVTAAIRPNDSLDLIASAYANEIMGGLHRATASSDRNAIIEARREWGMLCYVINDNKTYQLTQYNSSVLTDNTNWVEFSGSGGGGGSEWINSVLSVLTTEPLSPADGDRYLVGLEPTDTITGTNWNSHGVAGFVAQWSSSINDWNYTTPLDGMSLRVDDQDNSIYRYEGDYPTGSWQKEKVSQVRHIDAISSGGASYSATSSPYLLDYETETLYIVKFDTANIGGSVSLSINGLPHKTVRKTDGVSLTNIISNELTTNYQYLVTYNGIQFELLNPSTGGGGSGLLNKYFIDSTETITVPTNTQYWVYGDLGIDGVLDNYGRVVVVNGSLNVLNGSFNNAGTYSNLYFAEINGLGQYNYVPRWVTPFMLTATSSIYDDTYEVTVSSPTFSVLNDIVLPKGAVDGYVLTSDSNGVATWQQSVSRYSATFSFTANATQSITHNLNTSAIIFDFWNEDTGYREYPDVVKTGLNTIDVMSTSTILNGRVVIMS